jgi:putative hydrolase of the HAD superfamily
VPEDLMPASPTTQPIPYGNLEVLFLDVGNTLVSIDFTWVSEELGRLGVPCTPETLRRAEAAARPCFSQSQAARRAREKLHPGDPPDPEVVSGLKAVFCVPGITQRLWSWTLPGVPEALKDLARQGLRMIAVSNSDGTVEEGLRDLGLRDYFEAVVDSARVGFEKPDPRIFEHALELSGADRDRTLHVGDMFFHDVMGARGVGLHALLLDPFDDWDHEDCPRLPDLAALAETIRQAR